MSLKEALEAREKIYNLGKEKYTVRENVEYKEVVEYPVLEQTVHFYYVRDTMVRINIYISDERVTKINVVETPKEITIYGTKIKYISKDKDLVNEFITVCNNYIQDIADISDVIGIKQEMYNKGICATVYDDEIVNIKYGCYRLID